jgi:hypothetical protein
LSTRDSIRFPVLVLAALASIVCGRAEAPRQAERAAPPPPTTAPPPRLASEALPAAQSQPLPAVKSKTTLAFNIDAMTQRGQGLFLEGWAFLDDKKLDARTTETYVVLESGDNRQMFACSRVDRSDVAQKFGSVHLMASGFGVHVPMSALPKGTLPISLYVKAKGREALQFTGKSLENR